MIKKLFKQEKGVTLIALTVTIIILIIISEMLIFNAKDSFRIEKIKNLYNDIENLEEKIALYAAENNDDLPLGLEFTNEQAKNSMLSDIENKEGKFYVIQLSELDNLTLNYGKAYEEVIKKKNTDGLTDLYVINEETCDIFYVEGIKAEGKDGKIKTYYTNPKDEEPVYLVQEDTSSN